MDTAQGTTAQGTTGEADWASLTPPLLQSILWRALSGQLGPTLQFPALLAPGSQAAATARAQQLALARLACVCRRWRAAVTAAVASCASWAVCIQRLAPLHARYPDAGAAADNNSSSSTSSQGILQPLHHLRVASLDLRRLTWSEVGGGAACEALLSSPAFLQRSAASLAAVAGVPERLAHLLASFPALQTVGLAEDYETTALGATHAKSHLASMQLAPLASLPHLRSLTLELGVVELACLPPHVSELTLVEVDRIALPPGLQGMSVTDRLLEAVTAAGLTCLTLRTGSGCVVFEEANHAPLELELGHVARLLTAHPAAAQHSSSSQPLPSLQLESSEPAGGMGQWSVQLGMHEDEVLQQRLSQVELKQLAAAPAPG